MLQRFFIISAGVLAATSLYLLFSSPVSAYDQLGGGVCLCNSCDDCELAIADDVNCTDSVQLTTDILNQTETCINNPDGSDKTFDCQGHTIDGDDSFIQGIILDGETGANDITVQNCTITDFDEGVLAIDGTGTYILQNNNVSSCRHGIRGLRNVNFNALNNVSSSNMGIGIVSEDNDSATLTGNTANNNMVGLNTYHISQLIDGVWEELFTDHFPSQYETKTYLVHETTNELRMRFVQKDTPFGDIESIRLDACGRFVEPKDAYYINSGESVLEDIISNDLNVVVAHEKEIEVVWDVPPLCSYPLFVLLNANEYGAGFPMLLPASSDQHLPSYSYGTNEQSIMVDGILDDVSEPLYAETWRPNTGHPEGITYVYVHDDAEFVYFSFDVTSDNTNEYGEDWIEVVIETEGAEGAVFRVDDYNDTYGRCSFGRTDKVSYKHQMCELAIPKSELQASQFDFRVRYYGTEAISADGTGIVVVGGSNTLTSNTANENENYGIFLYTMGGDSVTLNNNTACSNQETDIYDYFDGGTVAGDNNECGVVDGWDDDGATGCTYVCDDTPPIFVQLPGSSQVINLTENQIVTVNPYTIMVKPQDPESGITKVEFYIDGHLICTVTEPDANGVYSCDWDTSMYHSTIRVVAYNGNTVTGEFTQTAFVQLPETGEDMRLAVMLGMLMLFGSTLFLLREKLQS